MNGLILTLAIHYGQQALQAYPQHRNDRHQRRFKRAEHRYQTFQKQRDEVKNALDTAQASLNDNRSEVYRLRTQMERLIALAPKTSLKNL